MQDDIVRLKELLKLNQAKRFGASSEKLSSEQLANQPTEQVDFFNEAETLEDNAPDITERPSQSSTLENHTRKKKPRVSIPADLPREEII